MQRWVCVCVQDLGYPAPKCKFCGGKGYWEEEVNEFEGLSDEEIAAMDGVDSGKFFDLEMRE